ncbi:Tripartite ATP-independent periplasmic transporters, DctQ component [Pigmentiphaga humi]|uniref:TRAP transporter small permease protein n=1 Tax=Pigmentiphaga humi TaxID=2478468 RepID=A0A3P4B2X9_9BURK|nr:TRAP transporter small permease [Pigmentiphaga humi]VCU70412.1 Tripartite ATP-independent periplasmic transporters, DctQ component [Pigmentiphaga humi]
MSAMSIKRVPDPPRSRFMRGLSRFAAAVGGTSLAAMILVTFVDVLGRNFYKPLPGASEIVSFLLGIMFFAGLSLVTLERAHISVGVLAEKLPGPLRRVEQVFTWAGSVLCCGLFAWMAVRSSVTLWTTDYLTSYLEIRLAWVVFGMAALAILAVPAALYVRPPRADAAHGAAGGSGEGTT